MPNDLKSVLFDFLRSGRQVLRLEGEEFTPETARQRLCELIPTEIMVMSRCRPASNVVVAAPHVSFDGWSEYFSRRAAEDFGLGRVVARHFRDDNEFDIPVSIGRHLHVNRPTESVRRGGREFQTDRSRKAFADYVNAIREAAGGRLPVDLLIEFHGHRRDDAVEIATTGIDRKFAGLLHDLYRTQAGNLATDLRIEPLHRIHYSARKAKRIGILQALYAVRAFHIEIPRDLRRPEMIREKTWDTLRPLLRLIIESY